jgi:hypothetical protein
LITLDSDSTILINASGTTWKNTTTDNDVLRAAAFDNSSAQNFCFF